MSAGICMSWLRQTSWWWCRVDCIAASVCPFEDLCMWHSVLPADRECVGDMMWNTSRCFMWWLCVVQVSQSCRSVDIQTWPDLYSCCYYVRYTVIFVLRLLFWKTLSGGRSMQGCRGLSEVLLDLPIGVAALRKNASNVCYVGDVCQLRFCDGKNWWLTYFAGEIPALQSHNASVFFCVFHSSQLETA